MTDFLFGGGSGDNQSPGMLGTGQYRATPVDVNDPLQSLNMGKSAFYNNYDLSNMAATDLGYGQAAANRGTPQMQAAQLGPIAQTNATQANVTQGTAAQGNAAQIGAMNTINNPNLGTAAQAQAAQIGNQDAQFRQAQLNLTNNLQNTLQGNGPSLAGMQLGQGNAAAAAQRMSQAASQRGYGNTASTNRQLAYAQGGANQATAMAAAQTRIQEQQAAQQALGNVLGTSRGQDINAATSQAQLTQQANLANVGATNQFTLQNAANQLTTSQANQNALNTAALQQAGYQQQMNEANLGYQNQFGINNMNASNQIGLANAAALNQTAQNNMGALNAFNLQQGTFNQGANQNNLDAALKQQQINDAAAQGFMGQAAGIQQQTQQNQMDYSKMLVGQNEALNQINSNAYNNAAQARSGMAGGVIGGIAGLAMSDEKEKDMTDLAKSDVDSFVNTSSLSSPASFGGFGKTSDAVQNMDTNLKPNQIMTDNMTPDSNFNHFSLADYDSKLFPQDQDAPKTFDWQNFANQASKSNNSFMSGVGSGMSAVSSFGGGSKGGGGMSLSDEKEKNKKGSKKEVKDFIDKLGAHKYTYKHPEMPGANDQTNFGPTAQELEKSKIGQSMVGEDDNGTKYVDYGRAIPALMAVTKQMHERLKKLESKRGK